MVDIKKEIIDFSNTLMNVSNGENFLLNSFAIRYITLKEKNINSFEYKLFNKFFENLGLIPKIDDKGEIIYERKIEKGFFKKKKQNVVNKYFNNKNNNIVKEKDLINDIFFNFEKEIHELTHTLNKF